jgi:DNA-binding NtrC family response regulator
MTIALFASHQVPLPQIAAELLQEGVSVVSFFLHQEFNRSRIDESIEKVLLISPERGVLDVGEQTEQVRETIGQRRRLILCAPQPNATDRLMLLECGASEIIEPQSWAAEHIAIRILSQLILDADIQPVGLGLLLGATRRMRELYDDIQKLAPVFEPVLIRGETGTGKELVAGEIHNSSKRSGAYIPINCPEITPELLSSELFGHKKGAFTGADRDRVGLIAAAGKGTVFLDEIGDLDMQAQAKLLRVLEDRKVRRVGANYPEEVEARVILATNRDLEVACEEGKFRRDLLERIRGFTLELPPLRDRKADIPMLVNHFVEKFNVEQRSDLRVPPQGIDCLFRYDWPGNVRELRAVIRKAAVYADAAGLISSIILQESVRGREIKVPRNSIPFDPAVDKWRDVMSRAQSIYFNSLLSETNGNKEAAVKLSGLSRSQFFEKIKELTASKLK